MFIVDQTFILVSYLIALTRITMKTQNSYSGIVNEAKYLLPVIRLHFMFSTAGPPGPRGEPGPACTRQDNQEHEHNLTGEPGTGNNLGTTLDR